MATAKNRRTSGKRSGKTKPKKGGDKKPRGATAAVKSFVESMFRGIHAEAAHVLAEKHGYQIHPLNVFMNVPKALIALLYVVFDAFRDQQKRDNAQLFANQQSLSKHQMDMDRNLAVVLKIIQEEFSQERLEDMMRQLIGCMGIGKLLNFLTSPELAAELLKDPKWYEQVEEEITEKEAEEAFKPDSELSVDGEVSEADRPDHPEEATVFGGGD